LSSLTSRSTVLAFARLLNYAVLLFSPLFLVRMLDVETYGMYREFVLYSLVAARIMLSGIPPNLLYFIPKSPEKEDSYVINTFVFTLSTTLVGISLILLFRNWLATRISFDFTSLMAWYVFFYVNLDIVESYWLAKKRSDYVFAYSTALPVLRMSVVIISAYLTSDVEKMILSMLVLEALKFTGLAIWWLHKLGRPFTFSRESARQQLRFIVPLGSGVLLATLNQQFGGLFVANMFGPAALAVYMIGLYQIPVISIVRSAISDVIFPNMVRDNLNKPEEALLLWRRANNVFCFIIFPIFAIFWVYAEEFITLLFTKSYEGAIPIFQVMLIMMLLQCFEFGTPLRSRNQNRYFLLGNMMAIIFNLTITFTLYSRIGLIAPAIAFLASEFAKSIYLAHTVSSVYSCKIRDLFLWGNILRIAMAALVGIPFLMIGNHLDSLSVILFAVGAYCLTYYFILRRLHIDEVELVAKKLKQIMRRPDIKKQP